jgi:hypothetical protein
MKNSQAMLAIALSYADAKMIDVLTGEHPIKRLTESDISKMKKAEDKRNRRNKKRLSNEK